MVLNAAWVSEPMAIVFSLDLYFIVGYEPQKLGTNPDLQIDGWPWILIDSD